MALGIALLILFVFVILFFVSIKYKKRIFLYLAIGVLIIIGIVWILSNTLFYYNDDMVSIQRTQKEHEEFNLQIKNKEIKYFYNSSWFACEYSIEDLLKIVQKQYDNVYYDEKFNQIVVVYENELFTICRMEDIFEENVEGDFAWRKKYEYIFSSDIVSLEEELSEEETSYIDIPFPVRVLNGNINKEELKAIINCDFEYLKKYYENFTNVEFGENLIEIRLEKYKCNIILDGTNVQFILQEY